MSELTDLDLFIRNWKISYDVILEEVFDEDTLKIMLNDDRLPKDIKKKLQKYYKDRSGIGTKIVKYYHIKSNVVDGHPIGRFYPDLGLAIFRSDVRNPLIQKYYFDIDFVNCHYAIALDKAHQLQLPYVFIEKYVNQRNEWLPKVHPDRAIAKKIILSLAYGGSLKNYDEELEDVIDTFEKDPETLDFMKGLKNEMENIANSIWSNDDEFGEWKRIYIESERKMLKNVRNAKYRLLSRVFQDIEFHHLMFLKDFMKFRGRNMNILTFDGGCVQKLPYEREFPVEILREAEHALNLKFGTNLKLAVKDIEHNYVPPDYELLKKGMMKEIEYLKSISGYEVVKKEFEEKNFKVNMGVCFVEINPYDKIIIHRKGDFKDRYQEMTFSDFTILDGGIVEIKKKFIDHWLDDPHKRVYTDISFDPSSTPSIGADVFNTFKGLAGEKWMDTNPDIQDSDDILDYFNIDENGQYLDHDVRLFMEHMKDLTGRINQNYDYFWGWLASIVQHRFQTKKSIIFQSKQGVGKDKFFKFLNKMIFGSEYVALIDEPKRVFERFNLCLENKFIGLVSEVDGKDLFEESTRLKQLIDSSGEITIERKNVNQYKMPNRMNLVFFTNSKNPVKIEKGDRRFVVFECNNEWVECDIKTKNEHFEPLIHLFDHDDPHYDRLRAERLAKIIYIALKRTYLSNFSLSESPKTMAYKYMMESNTSVVQHFFLYLMEKMEDSKGTNEWNVYTDGVIQTGYIYENKGLGFYSDFENWKQITGFEKFHYSITKFCIEAKRDFPFVSHIRKSSGMVYTLKYEDMKKFFEESGF